MQLTLLLQNPSHSNPQMLKRKDPEESCRIKFYNYVVRGDMTKDISCNSNTCTHKMPCNKLRRKCMLKRKRKKTCK